MPTLIAHQRKSQPARSGHAHPKPAATRRMAPPAVSLPPLVQAKLRIGPPNDKYEQEAERSAEQVMRIPDSGLVPLESSRLREDRVQLKCSQCEDEFTLDNSSGPENEFVQRKTMGPEASAVSPNLATQVCSLRGAGRPLSTSSRAFFEPRFDRDFSRVRVHTGARDAGLANALGARAFTIGRDVVFASGQYSPDNATGRRLLAHELTHTIQQGAAEQYGGGNPWAAAPSVRESLSDQDPLLQRLSCNFFVYDSTEPTKMGTAWAVAARARAAGAWGGYAIPSGGTITKMLDRVLDKYVDEDCDCTEEIQFWSHGSPGNGMFISKSGEELTAASFNIPGVEKYGDTELLRSHGSSARAVAFRKWYKGLSEEQKLLVELRKTICGSSSEVYYRSCEAFQGASGHEFAKVSAEFWRSRVRGHTKIIGLTQPGEKVLKPGREPNWSESEGTNGTRLKKDIYGDDKAYKPKKK